MKMDKDKLIKFLNSKTKSEKNLDEKLLTVQNILKLGKENDLFQNVLELDRAFPLFGNERSLESVEIKSRELVLTSYFTSKSNPQGELSDAPSNNIDYIAPWYKSVNELKLNGIVFYDNLNSSFVKKYTTDYVQFAKCTIGSYSLNDERFIIYYLFLLKYYQKISSVLMTDARDVRFTQNPFDLIRLSKTHTLFLGRDEWNIRRQAENNPLRGFLFQLKLARKLENNFYNLPVYNAGILGGDTVSVLYFLRQLSYFLLECDSSANLNMPAFNYTIYFYWFPKLQKGFYKLLGFFFKIRIYKVFKRKKIMKLVNLFYKSNLEVNNRIDLFANTKNIVTSYPLCSGFKKFEENSDAFIIHK